MSVTALMTDASRQQKCFRIMWLRSDLLKTVKVVKSFGTGYNRTVQYLLLRYLSGASAECRFAFFVFLSSKQTI